MRKIKIPEFPHDRIIREGTLHFCKTCGSSAHKDGFLGLWGDLICDQLLCKTHKINTMGEVVKVTIEQQDEFSYITPTNFVLTIKMSPEFMREPKELVPDAEKIEAIVQKAKEEMIKYLSKNI